MGTPAPIGWAVAAALAGVLLALVLHAPARWLADAAAQASGGRVRLVNPQGTVWNGQANLLLAGGDDSRDLTALPGVLRWRLGMGTESSQGNAAGFGPVFSLQASCCMTTPLRVHWQPGWQTHTLTVTDHRSEWPASVLSGLGTPWNTLKLQGTLSLQTQGLQVTLAGNRLHGGRGQTVLDVVDAASQLSTVRPLGSYRATWQLQGSSADTSATVAVQTLQGALQLQGEGQWLKGRLRFDGVAQAASDREEALANLMGLLGRRQHNRVLIKIG